MPEHASDPTWTECSADFAPDGSLRDIYVENTTLSDWDRLLQWVRSSPLAFSFLHEGRPMPLPAAAGDVFALSGTAASILTIHLGALSLNCHFFSDDEIELDLDPRELTDERAFSALLGFVRGLGDALARDAIVTHENFKWAVLLRYTAATRRIDRVEEAA